MPENNIYDIASWKRTCWLLCKHASRYKLTNIVFGKLIGGTITEAHKVCNYPGLPDVSGIDLGYKFHEQAKEQGAQHSTESIVDIKKEGNIFKLFTDLNKEYLAKTVLLATGTERNKLVIPKEEQYVGKGLSYCATCDAMFYKDKVVAVVGGSNAATMAATMLSDIAKQYISFTEEWNCEVNQRGLNRSHKEKYSNNIQTLVVGLEGEPTLQRVKLSKPFNDSEYLDVDGVFVEIGSEPNITLPVKLGLELDIQNYIKVDEGQATSIEGIWAAGDCTTNSNKFKQLVTAVSEGGVAANSIYCYLKQASCSH